MVSAIIVAGGKGLRMGSDTPKQFLEIRHKPILMHTIEAFHYHPEVSEVIVVLPLSHFGVWNELCQKHSFDIKHKISAGGATRYHSVKSGLLRVSDYSNYIMVHDAVRPFVSRALIDRLLHSVKSCDAVVPVVESVDSLREQLGDTTRHIDRSTIKRVQTPQIFKRDVLQSSYDSLFSEGFTDDASVVESAGYEIRSVIGDIYNIKITNKLDLTIAENIELLR